MGSVEGLQLPRYRGLSDRLWTAAHSTWCRRDVLIVGFHFVFATLSQLMQPNVFTVFSSETEIKVTFGDIYK